jgi:hypothetical protein
MAFRCSLPGLHYLPMVTRQIRSLLWVFVSPGTGRVTASTLNLLGRSAGSVMRTVLWLLGTRWRAVN